MPHVTTADGTELYVKDWGSGRPVVLIHGWPLNADSWDDQAVALAEAGYRAIAYDRRGFGRSSQPWDGYDYDTLADDLASVLEATGAHDATLAGFSMGGGEVARYLSRHGGKRVAQAALIGSVVPYVLQTADNPDGAPLAELEKIKDGIRADRPKFFRAFVKQFYGVGLISHPVGDDVLDWTWSMAMMAGLKGTLDCVDAFGQTDFRADLPAFTVPTLIVHGDADANVPIKATGRAAARAIQGSQLIEYSGAPHGLPAAEKDRLTADLLAFVRS